MFKSRQSSSFLWLLVLFGGANSNLTSREIIDIIKVAEEFIKRAQNQSITLLMAAQESWKGDVRDYVFDSEDFNTSIIHRGLPREMVDRKTGGLFYDYPRFQTYDTPGPFTDQMQLFHNMLLKAAGGNVKLIYVLPFEIEIRKFRRFVLNIVSNTYKAFGVTDARVFKDNMGLIGSGYVYGSGGLLVQNREIYIERAGKELQKLMDYFIDYPDSYDVPSKEFLLDFMEILTERENHKYIKITTMAFHEQDRLDIDEKVTIRKFIDKLKFSKVPLNNSTMDAGIRIAQELADEINEATKSTITKLGEELTDKYTIIDDNNMDLVEDYNRLKNARVLFDKLKQENFSSLNDVAEKMAILAKEINMDSLAPIIRGLLTNQDMMNDLEAFTETSLVDESQWISGLDDFNTFLHQSEKWSSFLIHLYDQLPLLIVESNINVDDYLSKIYPLLLNDPKHKIKVRDLGLEELLKTKRMKKKSKRNTALKNAYEEVLEMEVEEEKIYSLQTSIISSDVKTKVKFVDSSFVQIIGKVVKASEVANETYNKSISQIDVFVMDTFILDVDLNYTGEEVTLNIIANKWDIQGKKKIILEGEDAPDVNEEEEEKEKVEEEEEKKKGEEKDKNKNEDKEKEEEKIKIEKQYTELDGAPGLPGGPGGHFLGIAVEMEGGTVTFSTLGGRGGRGLDGTKGKDGDNGSASKAFNWKRFKECTSWFSTTETSYFPEDDGKTYYPVKNVANLWILGQGWFLNGTDGKPGQNGGRGGKGGHGGNAGNGTVIVNIGNTKFDVLDVADRRGPPGKGMPGGRGGKHVIGPGIICFLSSTFCFMASSSGYFGKANDGETGKDGENDYRMKQPKKVRPYAHYKAVNRFKMVIREQLKDSIKKDDLMLFLQRVEENPRVRSLYDHLAFIDELKTLEEQFHLMYNHIDLLPFYESLLNRTELYSDSFGSHSSRDIKLTLTSVYTATFSKVCLLRNNVKRYMIVDVHYFLSKLLEEIKVIEKVGKEVMIHNQVKEYKQEIEEEIEMSNDIIIGNLVPEIEATLKELEMHWEVVKEETARAKIEKKISDQQAEARVKNTQLRKFLSLGAQLIMNRMLVVVDFAKAFSKGGGKGLGKILGKKGGVFDSVTKHVQKGIEYAKGTANDIVTGISKIAEKTFKFLDKPLKEVQKALGTALNYLGNKLNTQIGKLKEVLGPPLRSVINDFKEVSKDVNNYIKDLHEDIKNSAKEMYEITKNRINDIKERAKRNLSEMKDKIKKLPLESLSMKAQDIANEIDIYVTNEFILIGIDSLFGDYDNSLVKINSVTSENFDGMENELKTYINSASKDSPVELTITKFNIKKMMTDVRHEINKMLAASERQADIDQCFEKLISLVDTIIDIFEKIKNNEDQIKLAHLSGNLQSAQNIWDVSDKTLYNSLNELTYISKTSSLIVDYNRALDAFKQYVFPFAHHFLAEFASLPSVEVGQDLKDLLFTIIPQIEKLYSTLDDWIYSITPHDTYIFQDVLFTDFDYIPFYTFPYSLYNSTIKQLLLGKAILLKPDLSKGVNDEAIKFNKIGINLKLRNKKRQRAFDHALAYYDIEMVHKGNNYFRCAHRYFLIVSEELSICYSYDKNIDGNPLRTNSVYDKIAKNDFFLSPYAFWTIKLENVVDDNNYLEKYLDEPMDILLEGVGQFVEMNDDLAKVCNGPLQKYYFEFDKDKNLNEIIIAAQTTRK